MKKFFRVVRSISIEEYSEFSGYMGLESVIPAFFAPEGAEITVELKHQNLVLVYYDNQKGQMNSLDFMKFIFTGDVKQIFVLQEGKKEIKPDFQTVVAGGWAMD